MHRTTQTVTLTAIASGLFAALAGHAQPSAQGCGLFGAPVSYAAGGNAGAMVSGDFNRDGKVDLAIVNVNGNSVSILLGNGDGSFAAPVGFPVGSSPVSLTAGEFNGDGKLDLAVANHASSGTVSILLGNGDGTFAPAVDYAAGSSARRVTAGDINGDGKIDLAVANENQQPNNILMLLGNGDGTFTAGSTSGGVNPADFMSIRDVNGDGRPDLVAVSSQHITAVGVALGHGDGTFAAPYFFRPPSSFLSGLVSLAIADVDGDGKVDLGVVDEFGGAVWVMRGNGDGTFGSSTSYAVGTSPLSIASADVNGDGNVDFVVANAGANNVSVLLGGGNGAFAAADNYAAGGAPGAVAVADFNGDGRSDVATIGGSTVSILLNAGGACPPPAITSQPPSQIVHAGERVTWTATASGSPPPAVRWQYSTNSGASWNDIVNATSTTYSFVPAVGDSAYQFRAVFTSSSGTVTTAPAGLTVTSDRPLAADLDGDRKTELMVWRPPSGLWEWLSSSSAYAAAEGAQWGNITQGDVPLVADVDGDGIDDFLVWRAPTGTWYWLTSSSGYNAAAAGARQWGNASLGDVPLVGDIDGDGKADLMVWRASTATFYWLTSSSGFSYGAAGQRQWGNVALGDVPILGDFDGDGRTDLAVWRQSTGTWLWVTSSSAYTSGGSVQWGSAAHNDRRFLRDIDGDGKADLLVWRPSSGTWFWLTSSTGYNYASQGQKQWGAEGDTPLAADVDGDGKPDLIVWRPSSGMWYWLTSSSGYDYAAAGAHQWGSATAGS